MKKTLKRVLGILAFSAMIPVSVLAADEPPAPAASGFQAMRQQAEEACAEKKAGDEVQLTTPCGAAVPAVCKEIYGKMAARPKHKSGDFRLGGHGWHGSKKAGHWKKGMGAGMGFGLDNCYITHKLNLTPEQKTEIRTIIDGERQKNANLIEQLGSSREGLREAMLKTPFDEAAVRKIAAEREQLRTELMVSWASAINRAMAVLTPEQQETATHIGIFKHGMGPGFGWGMDHGYGRGKGHGYGKGRGHGHGKDRKWNRGPRDGSGPNPDCPWKK